MNARRPRGARRRRGVVLILILAMLGLLALIGVTFATFSGQSKTASEYAAQAVAAPPADQVIGFGLEQLINDSNNPKSAIRGHSLLRDMYGRDFYPDPNNANGVLAYQNVRLTGLPEPDGRPLWFTQVQAPPSQLSQTSYVVQTNIPTLNNTAEIRRVPDLYGLNFTGNALKLSQYLVDTTNGRFTPLRQIQRPDRLTQTFEIVQDDFSGQYHVFLLTVADQATTPTPNPNASQVTNPPQMGPLAFVQPEPYNNVTAPPQFVPPQGTAVTTIFEIDGRYMRAFNGTGLGTSSAIDDYNVSRPYSAFPNFLYNRLNVNNYPSGLNDPNLPALNLANIPAQMDEDYDAPDNENWFLALRSADGQLVLPSFHRPGNIIYNPNVPTENDWKSGTTSARSKFLRPRKIDHPQVNGVTPFPDLIPDPQTGKIEYDVDNDGDGVTDSVWVDLGYPVQRDPSGKKYKPLFAFMVLGLNGRLPLNTAGNLHGRTAPIAPQTDSNGNTDPGVAPGLANLDHASHIGYSVNEINPEYALTPNYQVFNEAYLNNNMLPQYRAAVAPADGRVNLQLLTQGNPGYRVGTTSIPATEGRWGEVGMMAATGYARFPRPGRSYDPNATQYGLPAGAPTDLLDTDFNAFDFFPARNAAANPPTYPEYRDLLDDSYVTVLPVERMRRFLTPVDLSGNGRLMPFDALPSDPGPFASTHPYGTKDWGTGFDNRGRVAHYLHYRPPGISNADADWPLNTLTLTRLTDITQNVLNKLHGYEGYRNPPGSNRGLMGMMPWDGGTGTPTDGLVVPTFSSQINSAPQGTTAGTLPTTDINGNTYAAPATLGVAEGTQMNLFDRTPDDAPFGLGDQEWLDRKGDVDDSLLQSRLASLVDPSNLRNPNPTTAAQQAQANAMATYKNAFTTDPNAAKNRKLFVTETWDLNVAVAPIGSMGWSFGQPKSASILSDGSTIQRLSNVARLPSLVHGGKRFNLNLPLPPSDSSTEPVRQKYVRELYTLMKSVIAPPDGASLTGEQLAAIGQFAVNVVDFRDPDGTMTRFDNYDITYTLPSIQSVVADPNAGTSVSTIVQPASVAKATGSGNTTPVVQWGMEYNPIAINEVLAYQYTRKDATLGDKTTPRLFIELVNTLTSDYSVNSMGAPVRGKNCDQDLRGWGLIITQDNPSATSTGNGPLAAVERPNMVTGQLGQTLLDPNTKQVNQQTLIDTYFVPLQGSGMGKTGATYTAGSAITKKVPALSASAATPNYFVLGNAVSGALTPPNTVEKGTPPVDLQIDDNLVSQIPQTANTPPQTADSDYYWVHLLRPANPNVADADLPNEPKVVVDSFRFPYLVDNGYVDTSNANNPKVIMGTNAIYSVVRSQPYRGGHFVPHSDSFNTPHPYGFTEQTRPTRQTTATTLQGIYNVTTGANAGPAVITAPIYHSINTTNVGADDWDYFPFHDRDFQSLAELMLVPACPPGLFTKLFVENADPVGFGTNPPVAGTRRIKTGSLPPTSVANATTGAPADEPHLAYYYKPPLAKVLKVGLKQDPNNNSQPDPNFVDELALNGQPPSSVDYCFNGVGVPKIADPGTFPYLAEAFFYSSGSQSGWYRLLEFLEIPSTSLGYIGPVAAGQNADWARRDLRPGLLNLNLITDEEVFFGLLDDARLNTNNVTGTQANFVQPGAASTNPVGVTGVPQMVTAIAASGMPTYTITPNSPGFNNGVGVGMKAAFADFLKLRDGGSGLVYSPFSSATRMWGPTDPTLRVSMPSRPFRSLASADINDTVLRPARLPAFQALSNPTNPDLGVRPTWSPAADLPRVPPRRIFQIPDGEPNERYRTTGRMDLASETNVNAYVPTPADHSFLFNPAADLFVDTSFVLNPMDPAEPPKHGFLGATTYTPDPMIADPIPLTLDHRWHPAYRTEMLSKVMNQTTVRTHQFAVWVTVGFFEVLKEGNPAMANVRDPVTNVSLAADQLGPELNAAAGKAVRYRYYFLIDRTRATGFNPSDPGDYRNLIVFQRRIE